MLFNQTAKLCDFFLAKECLFEECNHGTNAMLLIQRTETAKYLLSGVIWDRLVGVFLLSQ